VSFPEFFEFFERTKRKCLDIERKRSEKIQYDYPEEH
jgi:hypothetical protein